MQTNVLEEASLRAARPLGPLTLQRCANPNEVPALDRAVARATCQFLVTMDREDLSPAFVCRAILASRGAWVWPEAVIRQMVARQNEAEQAAKSDEEHEAKAQALATAPSLIPLSDLSLQGHDGNCASVLWLVNPDEVHQLDSKCVAGFAANAQTRLCVAHATLNWLAGADDADQELPILNNAAYLCKALGLVERDARLVHLVALIHVSDPLKVALRAIEVESMSQMVSILARWTGSANAHICELLRERGLLVQCGLFYSENNRFNIVEDMVQIHSPRLARCLERAYADEAAFINDFLDLATPTRLSASDVTHLADDIELCTALLSPTAQHNDRGAQILIYGPAGSGKTEFAKWVAQRSGLQLFEIRSVDDDGVMVPGSDRRDKLVVTLRALRHRQDAAVLCDYADVLFLQQAPVLDEHGKPTVCNAWLHSVLDNSPATIIWVADNLKFLSEPALQRMTLVQKMAEPPPAVKLQMARRYLAPLGIADTQLHHMAALPALMPGDLQRSAATLRRAGPADAAQAQRWLTRQLTRSRSAQGQSLKPVLDKAGAVFDVGFINLAGAITAADLVQRLQRDPHVNMCLHGVPGTGKTAFVRFIAASLGRKLIIKTASDLLSPHIGETEKNIAAMFEQTPEQADEAVLLLDEADSFLIDRRQARHSWERSQTNEFLARIEAYRGLFICTSNLFEEFDPAVIRRFQLKLKFLPLTRPQRRAMYEKTFGGTAPAAIEALDGAVPADFSAVDQRLKWAGLEACGERVMGELRNELAGRKTLGQSGQEMGFMARVGEQYGMDDGESCRNRQ